MYLLCIRLLVYILGGVIQIDQPTPHCTVVDLVHGSQPFEDSALKQYLKKAENSEWIHKQIFWGTSYVC